MAEAPEWMRREWQRIEADHAANPWLQRPTDEQTEQYVTLFDATFLPQGLCLHHSLVRHGGNFQLWVLCLDQECLETLQRLALPRMRLLDLRCLETPELLAVKPGRSRAEYCWTITPFSIGWVLAAAPEAKRVTYLDADVFFLKSPSAIFKEMEESGAAVVITEHGYAPEYDQTLTSGRFCVQFVVFLRGSGERVLHWWCERCLEWCYARCEEGKFGDQKYLEHFSEVLPGKILEICHDPRFQGPWNAAIFGFSRALLYHFHGLRIIANNSILFSSGDYQIPSPTIQNIYRSYGSLLSSLCRRHNIPLREQQHYSLSWKRTLMMKAKKAAQLWLLGRTLPPYTMSLAHAESPDAPGGSNR